ncbi:type II/IV secretion system protein [Megasphaera sp. MJR8396C]|nr:type II/IV secretion system protein [Megasphaera sp. MJR8396C]
MDNIAFVRKQLNQIKESPFHAMLAGKGDFFMDVNALFQQAVAAGASDIHIEPLDEFVRIRWRKDGVLQTAGRVPRQRLDSLVSRIKVLAGLDIANRRLPQDGRIVWHDGRRRLDLRISTLPTVRGEKIVVRILDGKRMPLALSALGMDGEAQACLEKLVRRRQGLILICGPTGSGKTTTLYAALRHIQDESLSIATLEDPVEILIDGLSQSQVQPKGGMVFQNGLRALLRQDPDVLVVGEIRDGETAQIAVRAALTGHVVFSTLHAPSAVEAAVRLSDMGVPAYLAADALTGIVSQRLVRRKTANGAYEGRFCLCEVVPAGPRFKEALRRSVDLPELTEAAVCDGAVLLPAVIERVLADGLTDEAELRRVCEGGRALWT